MVNSWAIVEAGRIAALAVLPGESDKTVIGAENAAFLLFDCGVDFRFRVYQFFEQGFEGTEVEVADNSVAGIGHPDLDLRNFVCGVAELAATGESPCILADGK